MKVISDHKLLLRLKRDDNAAFAILYEDCFAGIRAYVLKNSGSDEDAQDVFQESVLVFRQKAQLESFRLSSTISAYVFSVARNIWLNRLRTQKYIQARETDVLDQFLSWQENDDRVEKLNNLVQRVTDHCQWIITSFYFLKMPLEALMLKAGWKNKHTASNQKYKCIQMLRKEASREAGLRRPAKLIGRASS